MRAIQETRRLQEFLPQEEVDEQAFELIERAKDTIANSTFIKDVQMAQYLGLNQSKRREIPQGNIEFEERLGSKPANWVVKYTFDRINNSQHIFVMRHFSGAKPIRALIDAKLDPDKIGPKGSVSVDDGYGNAEINTQFAIDEAESLTNLLRLLDIE